MVFIACGEKHSIYIQETWQETWSCPKEIFTCTNYSVEKKNFWIINFFIIHTHKRVKLKTQISIKKISFQLLKINFDYWKINFKHQNIFFDRYQPRGPDFDKK